MGNTLTPTSRTVDGDNTQGYKRVLFVTFRDMSRSFVVKGFVDFGNWELPRVLNSRRILERKKVIIPSGSHLRILKPEDSNLAYRLVQCTVLVEDGGILEIGGLADFDFIQNRIAYRKDATLILHDSCGIQNTFCWEQGSTLPSSLPAAMINTGGSIPSNVFKTIKYPPGYLGKPIVGVQSSSGGGIPVAVAEVASSGEVSDAIAEATPVPHR